MKPFCLGLLGFVRYIIFLIIQFSHVVLIVFHARYSFQRFGYRGGNSQITALESRFLLAMFGELYFYYFDRKTEPHLVSFSKG